MRKELIDHGRRKLGPLVSRMARLSAALPLLPALATRLFRFDEVARRRLRGGRGVLARRGQLLLELLVVVPKPRVLLFQLIDALKRRGQLLLQLGNLDLLASHCFASRLQFGHSARFPQFHDAGRYRHPTRGARSVTDPSVNPRTARLPEARNGPAGPASVCRPLPAAEAGTAETCCPPIEWLESGDPSHEMEDRSHGGSSRPVRRNALPKRPDDRGEVQAFLDGLRADEKPETARTLAKLLVRQGKLTKFQAQCIYQGKTKGLIMGDYVVLDRSARAAWARSTRPGTR